MKHTITLFTWVFILIILGTATSSWFMSKHKYKCNPEPIDTHAYDSTIWQNERLIDSVTWLNNQLAKEKTQKDSAVAKLLNQRNYISQQYINLRDEINNTDDTGQLAITKRLLSELGQY